MAFKAYMSGSIDVGRCGQLSPLSKKTSSSYAVSDLERDPMRRPPSCSGWRSEDAPDPERHCGLDPATLI